MVKPGALLLLLAVAAGQFDLYLSQEPITGPTTVDIDDCKVKIYGEEYSKADVSYVDGSVAVCFKKDGETSSSVCVSLEDGGGSDTMKALIAEEETGKEIADEMSQFTTTSTCNIALQFSNGDTSIFELRFFNFGQQTALRIKSNADTPDRFKITGKVGESTMGTLDLSNEEVKSNAYMDLSGCRHNDGTFLPGQDLEPNPSNCDKTICDESANIIDVPLCSEGEICKANRCVPSKVVCTVTGSSVIDFFNREHQIGNRCAYTLLAPQEGSDFELVAIFKERRRSDVALLDHFVLSHGGQKMYVEQGGRVRVDEEILELGAEFETHHGVELLKDLSGVSFKIPSSTEMEVVFDGNSAHITVPESEALLGLCGNPADPEQTTSVSDQKSEDESADTCEEEHTDDRDDPECPPITEYCEQMKRAPFSACNEKIDPAPYITACTNILCHYPDVDGHKCQFFEAYAQSCRLKHRISVDWGSVDGCSAEPRPCLNQYCSEDEFCGEKPGGTRCFCRALFASSFPNALGEPTVCKQNSATLTLANCLLEDKGVDYKVLHLKDKECKGEFDPKSHMVTFFFDTSKRTCGAEVKEKDGKVSFNNVIKANDGSNEVITRHDQVNIDFSCFYKKPDIKEVTFKLADSSVIKVFDSGAWTYTLAMNAYTDALHQHLIDADTEVQLNQKIWVVLTTKGLEDSKVTVVTKSCWATSEHSVDDEPRYDLITNRCPDDSTVKVHESGKGLSSSFSFNMFQFTGKDGEIYLNCQVELCPSEDNNCVPECDGEKRRRRSLRSKYAAVNSALITMAWNK